MSGDIVRRTSGLLGSLVLFITLAVPRASAQQLPVNWQGWYAGGILGYAYTEVDIGMPPFSSSDEYDGITGGGLGGYNFMVTNTLVAGLEADITIADLGGDMSLARHKVSFLGRLGVLATPSLLIFGVAGLAGGQYEAKVSATGTTITLIFDNETEELIPIATPITQQAERDQRLWGYTIGAGFEKEVNGFTFPARFGVEYRYTDFNEWDFVALGQAFSIDPDVHEVRVRFVVPIN